MVDHAREVRYSDTFLMLVHKLTERGVEHARACRLAREALGELEHEPDTTHRQSHREWHGRMSEAPKRVTRR